MRRSTLALQALLLLPAAAQDGKLWAYFDSRETASGPRLELELADGTTRALAAEADALLLQYLPEASHPVHPQLSVDLGDRNRVLVRWALDAGLEIARARVRLTAHPSKQLPPRAAFEVAVHPVLASWEEARARWNGQPAFDEQPCAERR